MSQPSARQYEQVLEIAAPRQTVWEALTTATGLRSWFAPEAEVDPRAGGRVRWTWPGLHDWPQTIEEIRPGERLLTRYDSPVDDGAGGKVPLFMDFLLSGEGGRTTLRMVHSGFGPGADFDAEYDGISRGWPVELQSLRLYCERHAGRPRNVVWTCRPVGMDARAGWELLMGPEGLGCGPKVEALAIGDAFDFTTPDGTRFAGEALRCHEREFSGRLSTHGDAFLRISVEPCGPELQAWLWLASYDGDAARDATLQASWDAMAARLFAGERVVGSEA